MEKMLNKIRYQNNLQNMSIKDLNRECLLNRYRVELWKYHHKINQPNDHRFRNVLVLHKEGL